MPLQRTARLIAASCLAAVLGACTNMPSAFTAQNKVDPPPLPQELTTRMRLTWSGRAEILGESLANEIGYQWAMRGSPPQNPILVRIISKDDTAYEVIRRLAAEIQPQAELHLDANSRILEVIYR